MNGRRCRLLGLGTLAALGMVTIATNALAQRSGEEGWSAARLYDDANAEVREGALGTAILEYRRAELLSPRDPDIAANLALARQQAGLAAPALPWFERAARAFSVLEWTIASLSGLWLLCAALAANALSNRGRKLVVPCAIAAALAVVVSGSGLALTSSELRTAVIVTAKAGTELQLSPFEGATSETRVREGESLRADTRHGAYLHVRGGDGQQGWVDSAAVEPLFLGTS